MKKANSINDTDPFMREALETGLKSRYSQPADRIQRQQSR